MRAAHPCLPAPSVRSCDWEMVGEPGSVKILQARPIGADPQDFSRMFAQVTVMFTSRQKFAAYNTAGELMAGSKDTARLSRRRLLLVALLFHIVGFSLGSLLPRSTSCDFQALSLLDLRRAKRPAPAV